MQPFANVFADPGLLSGLLPVAGEQGLRVHHQQAMAFIGVNARSEPPLDSHR